MQLKAFLLSIIMIAMSGGLYAQDKIYKKDGEIINVKVIAVSTKTVTYKRFDYPDGQEYIISKRKLRGIKYENGTTDIFEGTKVKEGPSYTTGASKKVKYVKKNGDNVISLIPGAYTISTDGTINDAGLGLCYEHRLDKRGHISFNLPVIISFSSNKDFDNNGIYSNNNSGNGNSGSYHSFYIMPGVKFYPASNEEKLRYSAGASFFAIFGSEPYVFYDDNNNNNYTTTASTLSSNWTYAVYGLMLSNSVNIAATKHLQISIDLGMDLGISDNRRADNDGGLHNIIGPWLQFGLKAGYRF